MIDSDFKNNKITFFLDRDGTINIDKGYLARFEDIEFLEGSITAMKKLGHFGRIVIVTNQSGIARGYYSEEDLNVIHTQMCDILDSQGVKIDSIYFCPHHPTEGQNPKVCSCRKPAPGMLLEAKKDLGIELSRSYMIGDKVSDVLAGQNAGIKTVFLSSNDKEWKWLPPPPDLIAANLLEATNWIEKDIKNVSSCKTI